jgi:hypothetical protein
VMGGKDKKFLFFIGKKKMDLPPNILITNNLNWFHSLDKRIWIKRLVMYKNDISFIVYFT